MNRTMLYIIVTLLIAGFAGCNQAVDNLQANRLLTKANHHYKQEQYWKAMENYEKAVQLNPDLKKIRFHLGNCYAALFQAGKKDERNRQYGEKAIENFEKAKACYPGSSDILLALGYIYDGMSSCVDDSAEREEYFKKAEICYLSIVESSPEEPKFYYALAEFYAKYGKVAETEAVYEKRIAFNPAAPEGYYYYANYLRNRGQWDRAVENYEKRIYVLLGIDSNDPAVLAERIKNVPGEQRKELSDAFYEVGVCCWLKSYRTPREMMSSRERLQVTAKGMRALDESARLAPGEPNPWMYMGLMYRQMITAEPLKTEFYLGKYEQMKAKYLKLQKKKKAREALEQI